MIDIFNPFYCGIVLIVFSGMYIFKAFLGVTVPAFKILCGCLFAYAGICIIIGPNSVDHKITLFENTKIDLEPSFKRYSELFSRTTVDFSDIQLPSEKLTFECNNLFGITQVILNPAIPTIVIVDRVCATTHFPSVGQDTTSFAASSLFKLFFGSQVYRSHDISIEPLIEIRSRSAFGSFTIKQALKSTLLESIPVKFEELVAAGACC